LEARQLPTAGKVKVELASGWGMEWVTFDLGLHLAARKLTKEKWQPG